MLDILKGIRASALAEPMPAVDSTGSKPVEPTLRDQFDQYFETLTADTQALIRRAQEIRYQVYCVEHPFENPAEHPDGLETDEFDTHSVHSLLRHRPSGEAMGTVRLVLPLPKAPERSFAIQRAVDHPILRDPVRFPVHSMGEVSRFTISKQFRRRTNDTLYGQKDEPTPSPDYPGRRSSAPLTRLGLIQALIRMTAEQGVTHWCAMMEPKLLRMLSATSIFFEPIGELVEYHGLRQPCYCDVVAMLSRVQREQPVSWDLLTDGGTLWEPLLAARR
jgi:N-acyl amino acid synthase of PEP-CTERM/exosortase system